MAAGARPVAPGFVDALGAGGLLRQVEGRTVADVLAWLSTTGLEWRKNIRYVAIDMSTTYRAAVRTGLPGAVVVVDHFHVVHLVNKMLSASPPAEPAVVAHLGDHAHHTATELKRVTGRSWHDPIFLRNRVSIRTGAVHRSR